MKTSTMILIVILAFGTIAAFAEEQQSDRSVIAQDTTGVVVMVKEKYGTTVLDTCTVVMMFKGNFVLVHRDTPSAWYPTSFHSVRVVRRLSESNVVPSGIEQKKEPEVIAAAGVSIADVIDVLAAIPR